MRWVFAASFAMCIGDPESEGGLYMIIPRDLELPKHKQLDGLGGWDGIDEQTRKPKKTNEGVTMVGIGLRVDWL